MCIAYISISSHIFKGYPTEDDDTVAVRNSCEDEARGRYEESAVMRFAEDLRKGGG